MVMIAAIAYRRPLRFLLVFLYLCSIGIAVQAQPAKGRPNIVFILADDLGYGDPGCFGQQKIRTPHLDTMAAQGMRFTRFYAGSSVCAPSRSVFMTGQHTGHTPIRGNKEIQPEGQWPLPDTTVSVARILHQAGYHTGDFGKWGLGFVGTSGDPLKQGFDVFFGYNCQRQAHNYYPDHLWSNDTRVDYPNRPGQETDYSPEIIQHNALRFLDEMHELQHVSGGTQSAGGQLAPFFLYLSYTLPHAGLQVPDDSLFEGYKKQFDEHPVAVKTTWTGVDYEPQPYPHAAYATMVTRLDNYIGQVFDRLKAYGLDSNTLVIFASDNGPHVEGGNDPGFFNSAGGLRGTKRDLYEGGIRTPMIAWFPGRIAAGRVNRYIGGFQDLLPTFASLAGGEIPAGIDGISILPTLFEKGRGKIARRVAGKEQPEHEFLYWEFHESGGSQAVRMGKWKGVRLNAMTHPSGPIELYDLDKDPNESHNVADQNPKVVARIKEIMTTQHVEDPNFPFYGK